MTGGAVARRWACLAAAVALAAASIPWIGAGQAAAAPTLTVNSTADVVDLFPGDGMCDTGGTVGPDPECTLRAAIQEANLGPADEIVLPAGTYTLTIAGTDEDVAATGDLDITADLTITGADLTTTIVQAGTDATNGIDRVFETHTGVTATLSDLTIRFGKLDLSVEGGAIMNVGTLTIVDAVISDSIGKRGGGVYSQGVAADLTLTRVILRNNSATDGGGAASKEGVATFTDVVFDGNTAFRKGGGLETEKGATTITGASFVGNSAGSEDGGGAHLRDGTHTLTDVTFDNNTAARRGGGLNNDVAITTITGGTFSSNVATSEDGGGVNNRGGGANLTLTNVTISGNSAGRDGGGVNASEDITIYSSTITLNSAGVDGDGIHRSGKTFSIKNSIVAGNVGGGNCHGTITSLGYNLEDTALCTFTQPGDQQNADPLLGPLTDNGGPTFTHALAAGSPAMEAGTSLGLGVPGVDQRGVARPQDGDNDTFAIIDIGAYEHQFAVPNNPPTDISLVPSDVDENVPVGTVVGTLITTDPDPADTHTYDLVIGVGDTHNGLFTIVGDELRTDAALDFETLGASLSIRVETTDSGVGNLTYQEAMTVTLNDVNDPPVLAAVGDRSGDEGSLITFDAEATDPDVPAQALTFGVDDSAPGHSLPAGYGFDPVSGVFTWTPTESQGGESHTFVVTVSDDGVPVESDSETITVTADEINEPPVLAAIGDWSGDEGSLITFDAEATDPDVPAQTLTFGVDDSAPGHSLPPGYGFDPVSGVFTWTPTESQGGESHTFVVVVSDDGVPVESDSETITVTADETNQPPVITNPGNQTDDESDVVSLPIGVLDPDIPANSLTWVATGLPYGLTIDPGTGLVSGTIASWAAGSSPFSVEVTVDDGIAVDVETFSWTVGRVNDPVTAVNDGPYSVIEEGTLVVGATDLTFDLVFGASGSGPGQFVGHRGIAFAADGTMFVADSGNDRVQKFDGDGTFLLEWGVSGIGAGQFDLPMDVTVARDGNVYVTDLYNHRVQVFDDVGTFLFAFGSNGAALGEFNSPRGVDFGPDGLLYVADTYNHRVQVFHPDGSFVRTWGSFGTGAGQFNAPRDLAVDAFGNVFVADSFNDRMQKFSSTGVFLTQWGTTGSGPGEFDFPRSVDVGPHGKVFVADSFNDRVQVFDASGGYFDSYGSFGTGDGQFDSTYGVAFAPSGALFIGDIGNSRVQRLQRTGITANDTDPDLPNESFTVSLDTDVTSGSLILNPDGSFAYDPDPDYSGPDSFIYQTCDSGGSCDTATVSITVVGVNDPPVLAAVGDRSGDEGSLITFDAEATDPDVPAQTLTFGVDDSAPGHSLPAGYGFDPVSGVFTWTPTESQGGESHTFVVVVSDDGVPVESDSETITVTADETNDPPVLAAIGDWSGDEGSLITFDAEATDPDVPAQSLSFGVDDSAPGHSLPAGYGFDPVSGVFTWTPTESQGGESHTFVVVVSDDGVPVESDSETVTVTADETNQPPVVTNPGDQTDSEGVPIVPVAIPATDSDLPAQGLFWSALGLPPGLSIDPLLGIVSGTPSIGSAGSYPVSVTVTDGVAPTMVAFTWVIVANQAPVADPISDQAPDEGDAVTLTVTATDPEGDDLTWTMDSGPGAVTAAGDFSWTTTEADGPGVYSVTLRVTDDGVPNLSDTVTFTVTVGEVDAPPVASPISDQSVTEGGVVTVAATASDPDLPAAPLTWSLISGPGFVSPGGTYTWLPGEADGPGVYTVTLQVSDGLATDTVTFTVTVAEQNQPPVPTVLGTEVVTAGNTVSVVATATDVDLPVNTLTWTLVDGPGAVTVSGAYAWTTSVDTVPGSYAVSLAVFDGTDSSSVSFTVVVLESPLVNQPPVAVTDTLVVVPGRSGSVDPVANDTDPEGDTLSLVSVDTPPTGTLIVDGQTVTFTAPDDFEGPIKVGYVVGDSNGATTTGTIRIEADPTNHPPQGFPDVVIADDYRVLAIAVLANDVDVDGDQLHIVSVEAPADGRAEVTDGVTISYYPAIGWVGSESFEYVVADSAGNQDTVLVVITINAAAAEEAAERSDVLGTRVVSFRNPAADVVPVPFEATLGGSVSLMTDAFFQSLGAMSLPLVFLILGLLMVFAFGGFSEVPLLVAATRRRLWSIVLHHREVLYKVYVEPDEASAVIYSYEPTAGGIRSTDKAFTQRGRTWMPIDSPNGIGYVDATHLAETVAFEDFQEDTKPVQLVRRLTRVLDEGGDLTPLISQRGLVVAIGGRVHEIPIDAVQSLRGHVDADAPSIEQQFESVVAEPLRRALLDNPTISPQTKHSQTALISTELWNFPYLAIHAPGQPSWLVHFEYVHGRPSIVGFALDE